MDFLRFLEGMRFSVMDAFMSAVTYAGDELFFMALAIFFFWCVNKRQGYYIFIVGIAGTVFNQFLKLWYRIPRPWVLDPDFTIVESARAAATGYSFPSGHTQNIVGTMGTIAVCNRQKWIRIVCAVLIILVPFSRMYLGVHTPLDVGISFALALILVAVLYPVFKNDAAVLKRAPMAFALLMVCSVLYLLFVELYSFPADIDADNLIHGTKNAYLLLGTALGITLTYFADKKYINFDTRAPLPGQVLKYVLGLGLVIVIKAVLKAPLNALFNGSMAANAVRYFLMVVFAGCIWPLTFPFFAKLGKKEK